MQIDTRLPSSASFQFSIPRPILARRTLIDCIAVRDRVLLVGVMENHVSRLPRAPGKPSLITSLAQNRYVWCRARSQTQMRQSCARMRAAASQRETGVTGWRAYGTIGDCGMWWDSQLDPEKSPDQLLPSQLAVRWQTGPRPVPLSRVPAPGFCNFAASDHPITGSVTIFSWDEVVDF